MSGWLVNGMQGVRGSNPLSSTPGQRPSSASTAPDSPASGSRWAAICVARPIRSSDGAGCCRCRRPGSPGLPAAGGSVVSHAFAACCGRTVCPSVARPQDLLPGNGLGSGLGRRHQSHPPGKRAWQPVARLESSPAAKSDGRESARTADPCGFQPGWTHPNPSGTIRLSRICPDQQGGCGFGRPS